MRGRVDEVGRELTEFRSEVNVRFEDVAGQLALLNQRLNYQRDRIAKTEEEMYLLKERQ